ncbi:MAG: beta-galactosidase [Clostridia bacterium]|nr:beta-galactosidase [Clostridia bacterium]
MKKFPPLSKEFPHFLIGGDYNPEQWLTEEGILEQDIQLMKEGNCNEMTMAIHAWDAIEVEEGVFDFSWLDERMDAIYQNGGRVILATPTAAHPRWMNEKYPEIMIVNENDDHALFSGRLKQCLRSPIFREKVRIIDEKLAERYGNHPALIAWHLNNEYRANNCYCPQCQKDFREWVRAKYHNNIDLLNRQWWTSFWSHRYQSFEQIEPPYPTRGETSITGLSLDWRRFVSDTTVDFVKLEADAIRKYSDRPITTNCMGGFGRYDHRKMAKHLDFYSNDSYPSWFVSTDIDTQCASLARTAALCRGMKDGKPYILMESAPGINVWRQEFRPVKTTEQQIFEAMFFVATGSDSVMYFQWRKGRGGGEKYHGAIVDHLGSSEHRVFQAVKQIGGMLKKMDGIIGTSIRSEIAIVRDYDTIWALNGSPESYEQIFAGNRDTNGYDATLKQMYTACWKQNIPADIIGYETDFDRYQVVILPSPYIMTEEIAAKLRDYVRRGGTVVSFYMAAMVNENDLTYVGGMPGCGLRDLFGLRVNETSDYSFPGCGIQNSVLYRGKAYPVKANADIPILEGAEKLGEYEEDFFRGASAVSKNRYGNGTAYHIAFRPDEAFAYDFIKDLCESLEIHAPDAVTGDPHIRVICREGDGEAYYFALNCSKEEQTVTLHHPMMNILEEKTLNGSYTLPPFGYLVLKDLS